MIKIKNSKNLFVRDKIHKRIILTLGYLYISMQIYFHRKADVNGTQCLKICNLNNVHNFSTTIDRIAYPESSAVQQAETVA